MKASSLRIRRAVVVASATLMTTGALIAGVVASPIGGAMASPRRAALSARFGIHSGRNVFDSAGPGYRPPGGIYAPFTDCPLLNPLMQESVGGDATGCVAGIATGGTFTVGSLSVPVEHPVIAQFGVWDPPGASPSQFTGGILPPPDGKQLVVSPELVPGGLLQALSCPNSNGTVEKLCREAVLPGETTAVDALVQTAGPITNFALTTWTQPVKIRLINPLLGTGCYIGSDDNPIVLNPSVTGTLGEVPDPNPARFPTTAVLEVTSAAATDNTFSVPVATGCGPGGSADIAIDVAIDSSEGLPSASGSNSLVLNGNFYFADDYSAANQAHDLLEAFKASHDRFSLPAGTTLTGALQTGTDMVFTGAVNGVPVTVNCTAFSVSGQIPPRGFTITLPAPPSISGCTDNIGGADTVTTNQTNGSWTLTLIDVPGDGNQTEPNTGDKLRLTIPTGGLAVASSTLPSCTVTAAPSAPAGVTGAYDDVSTDSITNASFPVSGSGCSAGAAAVSATVVFSPGFHDV